jgi:hydrogenase maturation protease
LTVGLIGLGNILLGDEGVGVHVVRAIGEKYIFSPEIEIIDGGTLGLDLLSLFEKFDKVLIIDAVNFGKEPGYVGILEDDNIPAVIFSNKLSVHHIGLADVLSAAKLMGVIPSKVCLIGIQPSSVEFDFGLEMSNVMNANIEKMIDLAIKKLKEWNIECALRSPQESLT